MESYGILSVSVSVSVVRGKHPLGGFRRPTPRAGLHHLGDPASLALPRLACQGAVPHTPGPFVVAVHDGPVCWAMADPFGGEAPKVLDTQAHGVVKTSEIAKTVSRGLWCPKSPRATMVS